MQYVRLSVALLPSEAEALREMAGAERRRVEAQAAWLIRGELKRRGLLQEAESEVETAAGGGDVRR